ncbi:MAG: ferrous iron transport protein B [Flavobacteriaceae bacterium]|jgi:ferrous iron transport protein B|nr:ferrous iron transport protein B [Flavobacteriaceae bacterium]
MKIKTIAFAGNPNAGKTTLFNRLSGLHQKTGNYPGITVEKKNGKFIYKDVEYNLIDLPGAYSLYPSSTDEEVVFSVLANPENPDFPDEVVVVADVHNMKRSLFLYQQIKDLKIPVTLVINQIDTISQHGISIKEENLSKNFDTPVVLVSSKKGEGIAELKELISQGGAVSQDTEFRCPKEFAASVKELKTAFDLDEYHAWLYLSQSNIEIVPEKYRKKIKELHQQYKLIPKRLQLKETIQRHQIIDARVEGTIHKDPAFQTVTDKIDKIATHPFWGYVLFFSILFIIFQALFFLSSYPQDWIEGIFANGSEWLSAHLPAGPLAELFSKGILPGVSGVAVFIPQIAILFLFLLIMEESGYMARVVFLMDRWFKPLGLSGKSVVPLLSGAACAIPAILSSRNIENAKERLITILVTPFITCSARLPVYSIIIALIIPKGNGFINLQGVAMMAMYMLGVMMAFISAFIANKFIKSQYKSYLVLDMPTYKAPFWKNVFYGLYEKSLSFITEAGKIIVAVSVILWALGTFGISENEQTKKINYLSTTSLQDSYLGEFGKMIEPVFVPLGYDWKIDIGLLSSFAAREVFVGTIASIYSMDGGGEETLKLKELMKQDINHNTGELTYNMATGVSLLLFYAFAMQCVSTLAVVKKETNSWKWPLLQLFLMSGFAYVLALIAYQLLK